MSARATCPKASAGSTSAWDSRSTCRAGACAECGAQGRARRVLGPHIQPKETPGRSQVCFAPLGERTRAARPWGPHSARLDHLPLQMGLDGRPFAFGDAVDAGVAQRAIGGANVVAQDTVELGA